MTTIADSCETQNKKLKACSLNCQSDSYEHKFINLFGLTEAFGSLAWLSYSLIVNSQTNKNPPNLL